MTINKWFSTKSTYEIYPETRGVPITYHVGPIAFKYHSVCLFHLFLYSLVLFLYISLLVIHICNSFVFGVSVFELLVRVGASAFGFAVFFLFLFWPSHWSTYMWKCVAGMCLMMVSNTLHTAYRYMFVQI